MNKKLFVGNLSYSIRGEDLKRIFSEAGNVIDAVVITDRESRRSKGFGFVEMETEEEAQKAIEMFNEKDVEGRKIFVSEARDKTEE